MATEGQAINVKSVKTFTAKKRTVLEGIRHSEDDFAKVITLLAYGTPIQAIVHSFGMDERNVANMRIRADIHCASLHIERPLHFEMK